jgi:rare lipoprotein A
MEKYNAFRAALAATLLAASSGVSLADGERKRVPPKVDTSRAAHPPAKGHQLDTSGQRQVGKASFYADKFVGRKMADGKPMDPRDDNAASKTLPLGTKARVTNLETGRSAVVTIQDRGPFIDGRIVDLSPATAQQIGLTKQEGLAPVEVVPIVVPLPDGSVKLGEGAIEQAREQVAAQ